MKIEDEYRALKTALDNKMYQEVTAYLAGHGAHLENAPSEVPTDIEGRTKLFMNISQVLTNCTDRSDKVEMWREYFSLDKKSTSKTPSAEVLRLRNLLNGTEIPRKTPYGILSDPDALKRFHASLYGIKSESNTDGLIIYEAERSGFLDEVMEDSDEKDLFIPNFGGESSEVSFKSLFEDRELSTAEVEDAVMRFGANEEE